MTDSFANIIGQLSTSLRKTIRKYEHTNRKLIKAEFALRFNEQCLNEDALPIYTNIEKIYANILRDGGLSEPRP